MIHGKTGYCIKSLYVRPASVFRCIRYSKLLISPLYGKRRYIRSRTEENETKICIWVKITFQKAYIYIVAFNPLTVNAGCILQIIMVNNRVCTVVNTLPAI